MSRERLIRECPGNQHLEKGAEGRRQCWSWWSLREASDGPGGILKLASSSELS